MKKHGLLFVTASLLALALFFTSCDVGEGEKKVDVSNVPVNWITVHPTSADYTDAGAVAALKVQANPSDDGALTYQWYENTSFSNVGGTKVSGATSDTYAPNMAGKTEKFFYVVIIKTTGGKEEAYASNPARIRIVGADAEAPAVTVAIGTDNRQYVRGFGGMSNAFGITPADVARYMRVEDIDTMFNPDTGLGYNILRIMIWPKPLDEVVSGQVEPQMNNQLTYINVVKKVNEYGGYVLASPWTPPPEWKVNESEAGTSPSYLLPKYYGDYAEYLAAYAAGMASRGAPIYTLSIQNEPSWPASYAGCEWSTAQHLAFFKSPAVKGFLKDVRGYGGGKRLDSVLVMSGEPHQNVTWNNSVKNDAEANAEVDIYAYHIYGSMNGPYTDVQADKDGMRKEVWMTEHNINSGSGQELQDYSWDYVWLAAEEIDHVIRVNSTNAFVWWYLKRYYAMVGDNAWGTVEGEVMPRGWVMSHWAKFATDTVRVPAVVTGHPDIGNASDAASTGKGGSAMVKASAYRRKAAPAGWPETQVKKQEDSVSLVIFNQKLNGTAQDVRVTLPADFGAAQYVYAIISDSTNRQAPHLITLTANGTAADFNLPANSIVSLKFTK